MSETPLPAPPARPVLPVVPALPVLDPAEQRVLGALLEKELTVPGSYPMTVNALRTACNQSSSREPIVDYDERLVHDTLRALKQRDLVRVVWQDTGRRTMKYLQLLDQVLALAPDERAVLTVLLLRGAAPAGALRSRTERLHTFADRDEVERVLTRLAAADPPLVRELERQRGQQDARWIHLLGPVEVGQDAAPAAGGPPTVVDRESVVADGSAARDERVRTGYDAVAVSYADSLVGELADLPFERWLLGRSIELAGYLPLVDVGCGPGHVTAHLAALGAEVNGIDLSPGMVAEARRRFPEGRYDVGDLRALMRPVSAAGWGAVLAWYSLIHLAASELPEALAALVRPLAPGGALVLALHAGHEVRHLAEWFGSEVDLDVVLHEPEDVAASVVAAGLVDVEWYHRGPHRRRGESTPRLYVVGRKPNP